MDKVMPYSVGRLHPLLVILLAASYCYPQGAAERDSLQQQIGGMVKLRGEKYVKLRSALLGEPGIAKHIQELKAGAKDPIASVLCEALLFRLDKPDVAGLLDQWWGREYARRGPAPRSGRRHRLPLTPASLFYPYLIMFCFGTEAFPVVSENLLLAWREPAARLDLVSTLLEMREPRAIAVLAKVAEDTEDPIQVRGSCLSALVRVLLRMSVSVHVLKPQLWLEPWRPHSFPEEFKDWPKKEWTSAPWPLTAEHRVEIFSTFRRVLSQKSNDGDHELLRAIAAQGLGFAGGDAVEDLTRSLGSDLSAWVRAWCAMSLLKIGGDKAKTALAERAKQEKDPDVLQVIQGSASPALPIGALWPGQSILTRRRPRN